MRNLTLIMFTVALAAMCFLVACTKVIETPKSTDTEQTTPKDPSQGTSTDPQSNTGNTPTTPNPTTPTTPSTPCCKTQNVIIVVIDGPRYTETWGDYARQNIPEQSNLWNQAVLASRFYNNGTTLTDAGHVAITNGVYESIDNFGDDIPQNPSIFQQFLKSSGKAAEKAWIITSKGKLEILANAKQEGWHNKYMPRTDCGPTGMYSGYRSDSVTMERTKKVIATHHPNLMLINFKDPDHYAHSNMWDDYIKSIRASDAYVRELYDLIQQDVTYKDKTTLIVTNDHGRHSPGVANGFVDHGCTCEGCKRIQFFAIGPDFKKFANVGTPYEAIDISKTVGKLLNFNVEYSKGRVMSEIFN